MKTRIILGICLILAVSPLFAGDAAKKTDRYSLTYSISISPNGHQVRYSMEVKDTITGQVVTSPILNSQPGISAEIETKNAAADDNRLFYVKIRPDKGGTGGAIVLEVKENDTVIQSSSYRWEKAEAQPAAQPGNEPITLHLKDADIHDVLKTLGVLTNREVIVDPAVTGRVSVNLQNVPWQDALRQVVAQVSATATVDATTIHVTR